MATSVDSLSIQISASTTDAKRKVDELCTSLNSLVTAIASIDTSKFDALSGSVDSLSQGLGSLKGTGVRQVKKVAEALHDVRTEGRDAFEPIVQSTEKLSSEAQKATRSEEDVVDAIKKLDATPLEDVSASIGKVSESLSTTTSKMSAFKSFLAGMKIIVPTEGLENVNKKIDKLTAKVADLKDKLNYKSRTDPDYVDSSEMEKDQQQIQGLINELDRLKLKKQELEAHGGFKFNDFGKGISALHGKLSGLNKKLDGFISRMFKAKSVSRDTSKATKDFSLSATKLAKELFRVSKMLKLMVTRMALRAVIKEVGNGFKSLALHSEEFNSAMSSVINASKKLGYSFAGMVGPLINALAPALLYIINLLTKLANALNQIFSALTGKGTWNKAKDFTNNWADDIKAANKQAKELKKTVLGFDELNQMSDKTTSGGDTSGNITDMFETLPIDSKFKDIADKIKALAQRLFEPIKKAWEKVGDFVKKSWKYAMDEVLKLGKSMARDFWKVWEQENTQKIFENLFETIGWIGQAIGNLARNFREAWDKNNTGLHILENIRDIVLIITEHIKNMAKATAEWADKLDFSPLLEAFEKYLKSLEPVVNALMGVFEDFYTHYILPLAKWATEKGGPELLKIFTDFNDLVEWDTIRERLDRVWKALEPFSETVGEGLLIFIRDVSEAVGNFLNSDNWDKFIDTLIKWMDNVKPEDIANGLKIIAGAIAGFKIGSTIATGITAVASAFSGLGGAILPVIGIIATVGVLLYSLTESYGGLAGAMEKVGEVSDEIWESIKKFAEESGLKDRLDDLFESVKDLTAQLGDMKAVWDVLFKIISTVGKFLAGYAIPLFSDAVTNITNLLNVISDYIKVVDKFIEQFEMLIAGDKEGRIKAATEWWDAVHKAYEDGLNFIEGILQGFSDYVIAIFKGIKYALVGDPIVIDMWNEITKVFEDSIKSVTDFVTGLKDDVVKIFTDIKTAITKVFTDIQTEMGKAIDKIKDAFKKDKWTFDGVGEGLKKTFEKAKEGIKSVWNSIADKLNGEHELGNGKFKINLPRFYATGGFPEDGWFRASHGELIGSFDNGQTVVANNAQIIDGISQGVYNAVSMAMSRNGNGGGGYIANTIVVDGEVIARTVTKAQNKQNMRYSPTMG